MTRDETLAAAEVMRRAANGEAVEKRPRGAKGDLWCSANNPAWDWYGTDYRIVEAPRYRPWTADEVPVGAVVRRKGVDGKTMILSIDEEGVAVASVGVYSLPGMLEKWTMLDGSPCGVRE